MIWRRPHLPFFGDGGCADAYAMAATTSALGAIITYAPFTVDAAAAAAASAEPVKEIGRTVGQVI